MRFGLAAVTLALLTSFSLVIILAAPLKASADIYFLIGLGNRILSGEVPYIDFYFEGLPIIQYLFAPAAAMGQGLGINGVTVWSLLTWLQLVFSLVLCYRLAKTAFGRDTSPFILLLIPLALAFLSWLLFFTRAFGQREHIFLIYAAPWLLLRFSVWQGSRARPAPLFAFGALVGVATSIKPYFFLVVGALELYWLLRHRSYRPLLSPEIYGFIAVNLLYLGLIVASPQVFSGLVETIESEAVYHSLRKGVETNDLINNLIQPRFLIPLLIGIASTILSCRGRQKPYNFLGALGCFTIMGALIVLVAAGGSFYMLIVMYGGAFSCAAFILLLPVALQSPRDRAPVAGLAIAAFLMLFAGFNMLLNWRELVYVKMETPVDLRAIIMPMFEPGDDILFMTGKMGQVYPWFGVKGFNHVSGMPSAWVLPLEDESDLAQKTLARYARLTRRDIDAGPPAIVVDKDEMRVPEFLARFDLLETIQSRYVLAGQTARFDVYRYIGEPPLKAPVFDFGDRFVLNSWELATTDLCDGLELNTWWRPMEAPDLNDYTLHVDLVSKETGAPLLESFERIGGVINYAGQPVLLDSQRLSLPCERAEGETVLLLLSLEDMSVDGGKLLPVRDSDGGVHGDYLYVGEFSLIASPGA